MIDPYTTEARLCDDAGMVSDVPVEPANPFDPELTYLKQLDNLRGHTGLPPYDGEPFRCTGSAHLAGEHIRCTSPAHAWASAITDITLEGTAAERAAAILIRRARGAVMSPGLHRYHPEEQR